VADQEAALAVRAEDAGQAERLEELAALEEGEAPEHLAEREELERLEELAELEHLEEPAGREPPAALRAAQARQDAPPVAQEEEREPELATRAPTISIRRTTSRAPSFHHFRSRRPPISKSWRC
jgi:hypothetical protein